LSRAKDIKDAFKVCPTPDPCLSRAKDIYGFLAYREPNHQFFLGLLDYPQRKIACCNNVKAVY
jgi:hypothetical protein